MGLPYAHARQIAHLMRACVGACHVWIGRYTPLPSTRCACGRYKHEQLVFILEHEA